MSAGENRFRDGKRKTRYLNQIENCFKERKGERRKAISASEPGSKEVQTSLFALQSNANHNINGGDKTKEKLTDEEMAKKLGEERKELGPPPERKRYPKKSDARL